MFFPQKVKTCSKLITNTCWITELWMCSSSVPSWSIHDTGLSFYIPWNHEKTRGFLMFSGVQNETSDMQWVRTEIKPQCCSHPFNDNLEHIRQINVGDHSFSTCAKIFQKNKVTSWHAHVLFPWYPSLETCWCARSTHKFPLLKTEHLKKYNHQIWRIWLLILKGPRSIG